MSETELVQRFFWRIVNMAVTERERHELISWASKGFDWNCRVRLTAVRYAEKAERLIDLARKSPSLIALPCSNCGEIVIVIDGFESEPVCDRC